MCIGRRLLGGRGQVSWLDLGGKYRGRMRYFEVLNVLTTTYEVRDYMSSTNLKGEGRAWVRI